MEMKSNYSNTINDTSAWGEINVIGHELEQYGYSYRHMDTQLVRWGVRLQELYKEVLASRQVKEDMFDGCERIDPVPRLTKKEYELKQRLESEE